MLDLEFAVEGAAAMAHAVSPQLVLKLRINQREAAPEPTLAIHGIMLQCQVRLEPAARMYTDAAGAKLADLFGGRERWGQTMRSLCWAQITANVPAFHDSILFDLILPCSFDFNVATTKYFYALEDGDVPLTLLFSGSIFHRSVDQAVQVAQIPWEKEAVFRLPVRVWRQMMDHYYPGSSCLTLRRETFDRLDQFKRDAGSTSLDAALEQLLAAQGNA